MNQGALRPDEPQSFAQAGTMRHGARRIVRPPTRFADGHQHQQQGNACEREDDEGMAPAEFFGQYPAADSPDTRTDGNTEREYHHSDNPLRRLERSEEHTSELQSIMRSTYADFSLKKKKNT